MNEPQIQVQLILNAIANQRNRALDDLAMAQAKIEVLTAELAKALAEKKPDAPPPTPPAA
ncbi:MAG: hypothetical protein NUV51_03940 [Sulfuricaulis sp.]|nr:hypothetical protein [Sulfuricaulis sp.]